MSDAEPYRSKEEVAEHKKDDPIEIVKQRILENNWATEDELNALDEKSRESSLKNALNLWSSLRIQLQTKFTNMFMLRRIIHSLTN